VKTIQSGIKPIPPPVVGVEDRGQTRLHNISLIFHDKSTSWRLMGNLRGGARRVLERVGGERVETIPSRSSARCLAVDPLEETKPAFEKECP
jgi:hypothetical protein